MITTFGLLSLNFRDKMLEQSFLKTKKPTTSTKKWVSVIKSLTKTRMEQLQKGKKELSFQNFWYNNGKKRFYIYWF